VYYLKVSLTLEHYLRSILHSDVTQASLHSDVAPSLFITTLHLVHQQALRNVSYTIELIVEYNEILALSVPNIVKMREIGLTKMGRYDLIRWPQFIKFIGFN
jgi:hypothetical protein